MYQLGDVVYVRHFDDPENVGRFLYFISKCCLGEQSFFVILIKFYCLGVFFRTTNKFVYNINIIFYLTLV